MSDYIGLPESWATLTVGDSVRSVSTSGKKIPQKQYLEAGSFPVVDQGQPTIGGFTNDASNLVDCEPPAIVFGDHTKVIKLITSRFAPGADGVKVLKPHDFFDPRVLKFWLDHVVIGLIDKGYARHYQHLANVTIPLPPLAEQKRIVAKIDELFSELEAGEASLRKARQQLGVYRQSLLKQAFEGKLTQPWLTQNPDKLAEWSWLTLQEIADVTGGLTKNSKRDSLPTRIPYLRVANVYANELRLDEIKDIGVTNAEAEKVRLLKGDLLIVEGNGSLDQIGRVALWNGSIPNCGHQNHLIRARCRAMAHPAFVLMFLLSPLGRDAIEKQAASTSGLHTLSVSKVQRLPVPLCSLPEQQEIVRLLDEQFEAIERNERELDAALKRSEALRQSILKKAFSGRLVPQDPADEPASALLARLRAERAAAPATKRKSSLP